MRSLCWKCNFRAKFGILPLGFDVKALIPQRFTGSPNYFGFLNNLMTLIICESLREIGEVACVTSAWSSRGQSLKKYKKLRRRRRRQRRLKNELIFYLRIVRYPKVICLFLTVKITSKLNKERSVKFGI